MKTIERTVSASPETVWELWTTADGIARWWAPDGFRTDVDRLDLQPGGELVYTMTAEDPAQVEFLEQNGLPLSTQARKVFTELQRPSRIAYRSVIDFVPDRSPRAATICGDTGTDLADRGKIPPPLLMSFWS